MCGVRLLAAVCCSFFASPNVSGAQQAVPPPPEPSAFGFEYVPLTTEQNHELSKWLNQIEKWQRYDAGWRDRPVYTTWGGAAARRQPPVPPPWLGSWCESAAAAGLLRVEPTMEKACLLSDDPRADIGAVPSAARLAEAPPRHSSFFSRLHVDGGWTTSSAGQRLYGLVGTHLSLVDVGRVQVFGPPGVILLSVPDTVGGRRLTIGYTWGISVRLADVRIGAPTKNLTLFVNLSKVWVTGISSPAGGSGGFDLVGLSLAQRKTPR